MGRWRKGPNGKILKRNGSIVLADSCCCYSCCPTAPELLRATMTVYDNGECTAVDDVTGLPLDGFTFDMDAAEGETNVWTPSSDGFHSANCDITLGLACGDQSFLDYHLSYDALINDFSPRSGVTVRATYVSCDPFRVEFDMIYEITGECCATEETPTKIVKIVIVERV